MDNVLSREQDGIRVVDSPEKKPSILITIDTEGDNLWARPRTITTENARFLYRFQELCESYGFKPTYLTNYEMAICPVFREFGRDIVTRRSGEIGMHLHAWNSPPLYPLTKDDFWYHPYLIEYPEEIMKEKISVLTNLLEDAFSVKMVSHRAGRWSFNETYARILVQKGYKIDCSVNPLVSYKNHMGDPDGKGGTDYSNFPQVPYFLDIGNIARPGNSPLLEVPMTNIRLGGEPTNFLPRLIHKLPVIRKIFHKGSRVLKFRPDGRNRDDLIKIVSHCHHQQRIYLEFMLHSSELMPNGSPGLSTERSVENLYEDLEVVFLEASRYFNGATLWEFYQSLTQAKLWNRNRNKARG